MNGAMSPKASVTRLQLTNPERVGRTIVIVLLTLSTSPTYLLLSNAIGHNVMLNVLMRSHLGLTHAVFDLACTVGDTLYVKC